MSRPVWWSSHRDGRFPRSMPPRDRRRFAPRVESQVPAGHPTGRGLEDSEVSGTSASGRPRLRRRLRRGSPGLGRQLPRIPRRDLSARPLQRSVRPRSSTTARIPTGVERMPQLRRQRPAAASRVDQHDLLSLATWNRNRRSRFGGLLKRRFALLFFEPVRASAFGSPSPGRSISASGLPGRSAVARAVQASLHVGPPAHFVSTLAAWVGPAGALDSAHGATLPARVVLLTGRPRPRDCRRFPPGRRTRVLLSPASVPVAWRDTPGVLGGVACQPDRAQGHVPTATDHCQLHPLQRSIVVIHRCMGNAPRRPADKRDPARQPSSAAGQLDTPGTPM